MRIASLIVLVAVLASPVAAQRQVWIADVGACPDGIVTAQAAIDSAADGDVVFVLGSGADVPIVIDGKSITLVAQETGERLPLGDNHSTSIRLDAGEAFVERCDVRDNGHIFAQYVEGAVDVAAGARLEMRDSMIVRNTHISGAALRCAGTADVRHCTFALNPDSQTGHEVSVYDEGVVDLEHCVVWGAPISVSLQDQATGSFRRSLLRGGAAGFEVAPGATLHDLGGLIDGPPGFQNSGLDDFHLGPLSPAIDAGDPAFVPAPGETDIDGDPRVLGAAVDLGADERVP